MRFLLIDFQKPEGKQWFVVVAIIIMIGLGIYQLVTG